MIPPQLTIIITAIRIPDTSNTTKFTPHGRPPETWEQTLCFTRFITAEFRHDFSNSTDLPSADLTDFWLEASVILIFNKIYFTFW